MVSDDNKHSSPEGMEEFYCRLDDMVERIQSITTEKASYRADWESLRNHEPAPEWFRDAKFGIYCHWGIYSVPAFESEWYPRWMYNVDPSENDWGEETYPHHVETYGDPDKFPYQEFVPEFTAENFDAEAWADLFKEIGVQFAGLTAEHHDGWSNWNSAINPWNAGERGPKRDLVGELEEAIRDRGIRFLTSFHHARTRDHYEFAYEHFPSVTEGYPDRVMYGNMDEDRFFDLWLSKLIEVIDNYQPDLIWHDGTLPKIPDRYHRQYLAYYFNRAMEWERDVVVTAKNKEFSPEVAIEDFERGRPAELRDKQWLTDTSITTQGWSYTQTEDLKSAREVIHELVDIVSKNGCLLLNFGPRPDGTIPESQREVLLDIGEWLNTHGEAIYETRPWKTFGEGPTRLKEGGHFLDDVEYTSEDIRYTQSKDRETLYAIVMGWPDQDLLTLDSVEIRDASSGVIELLGVSRQIDYEVTNDDRLTIKIPDVSSDIPLSDGAVVFALSGFLIDRYSDNSSSEDESCDEG